MSRKLLVTLVGIVGFLVACEDNHSDIRKINREAIFHCNSSKIWVVNKVLKKGVNHTSLKLNEKDVAIFYENKEILIQPIQTLGTFPSRKGVLDLSDDNQTCQFLFPKERWIFTVEEISSHTIKLKAGKNSQFPYDLELTSYPKSNKLRLY